MVAAFLGQPGLPFAAVLSAGRVERIFAKHKNLFAMGRVRSTVNVLWAFLGQVLRDGKQAAGQAAVAAITVQRLADGLATPTSDSGDYCKARAKLSEAALRADGRDRERPGRAGRASGTVRPRDAGVGRRVDPGAQPSGEGPRGASARCSLEPACFRTGS